LWTSSAPEAVDGLLGVADDDRHRRGALEGPRQSGPLDGIGVLALVDHHHRELGRQSAAEVRVLLQQLGDPAELVVEGDAAGQQQPLVDALHHPSGELGDQLVGGLGVAGDDPDARVGQHDASQGPEPRR
jgi:hypothetical protein